MKFAMNKSSKWFLGGMLALLMSSLTPTVGQAEVRHITQDTVHAQSVDTFRVGFEADKTAVIIVAGDHRSVVGFVVTDPDGKVIGADIDNHANGYAVVKFVPQVTGVYRVRIVNNSGIDNHYTLGTIQDQ